MARAAENPSLHVMTIFGGRSMSLTAKDVAEIMRLVEQSSFDELTLEIDGTKLSLRRGAPAAPAPRPAPPRPAGGRRACRSRSRRRAQPSRSPPIRTSQDLPAPLLGTFYRAPKPGAPPFVEVGLARSRRTPSSASSR